MFKEDGNVYIYMVYVYMWMGCFACIQRMLQIFWEYIVHVYIWMLNVMFIFLTNQCILKKKTIIIFWNYNNQYCTLLIDTDKIELKQNFEVIYLEKIYRWLQL